MGKIDFSSLTNFIPEAVNDMADLIKQELFTNTSLTEKVTVVDGIVYGKKVGYLTRMGDIGKKASATACALNTVNAQIGTAEKTWTPRPFDTRVELCAEDVLNSIAVKSLKKGVNRTDLTDTDYLNTFIEFLQTSMLEMYNRMTWLGDMTAARFGDSPAGYFSDTVDGAAFDKDLVNMQYGFFYRIAQVLSTETAQKIDLSTYNNQVSYALQKSTMTAAVALATAKKLTTDLPLDFNYENQYFGCTRFFYNALIENFQGFALESNRSDLINGVTGIKIDGVPFVPVPELDWMINRYQNSGTRWHNPHRVVAMRKDNLLLGVPDVTQWGLFEMFYDKLTRKFYIDIKDEFDTMILHDKQIAMAI